jgi:hypothetical protein
MKLNIRVVWVVLQTNIRLTLALECSFGTPYSHNDMSSMIDFFCLSFLSLYNVSTSE